tara:strand:- start:249 stop:467 length:219 start_codon:yes stop_codon:yes gene_type:complete
MKKKNDWKDSDDSIDKMKKFLLDIEKKKDRSEKMNEKSTKNNILNNLYIIYKILVIIFITILFGYIEWNCRS